jgi:4-hydroxybenzoate polyprenyltransferase
MIRSLARSCHPGPTLVVTFVVTALAWSLGWMGIGLIGVFAAVLTGQLSVGWSNDAFDARLDALAVRHSKPTVAGTVTSRTLWWAAALAVTASVALSWLVAGWIGGSFHVLGVLMGWTYNLLLSRTVWSWLPYLIAFGALPPFLTYGLDGTPPPVWLVAAFAIIGVSAHLANALTDIESDTSLGIGGVVGRLGARRATLVGWVLLGVGTAILAGVMLATSPLMAALVMLGFLLAILYAVRSASPSAMFTSLLAVVVLDVVLVLLLA